MYKVTLYEDSNDVVGTVIHQPHINGTKLTSGNIAQGINVVNSFTFSLNMQSSMYTKVKPRKSLVKVTNTKTGKDDFNGYILRLNSNMSDSGMFNKSFTAVDGLNYLKETGQPFAEIRNTTPKDFLQIILNNHNATTDNHKKFLLGTVNVTNSTDNVYRFLSQETNTFDTLFDKLVNSLGGELRTRLVDGQWYLDWLTEIGEVKQTEIRIGKNLKSQDRDEDTESVVTRWCFYGATIEAEEGSGESTVSRPRIDLKTVNGGKDYIDDAKGIEQFGIVSGREVFDDVNSASLLLTKGNQFVANYKQVTVSNQVTAYDLSLIGKAVDSYEVYNSYPLNNPGIAEKETVRIIEKRIDINNPQSSTLTIGDKFQTASQYQASTNKNNKIVKALQTTVQNQSTSIATLKTSNTAITKSYNAMQVSYNSLATSLEIDSETGTSLALVNLKTAIDNLGDDIVSYGLVTTTSDGLMISTDKVKLDNLEEYTEATQSQSGLFSASDKTKLNLVTVISEIDLDDLLARITALETV